MRRVHCLETLIGCVRISANCQQMNITMSYPWYLIVWHRRWHQSNGTKKTKKRHPTINIFFLSCSCFGSIQFSNVSLRVAWDANNNKMSRRNRLITIYPCHHIEMQKQTNGVAARRRGHNRIEHENIYKIKFGRTRRTVDGTGDMAGKLIYVCLKYRI